MIMHAHQTLIITTTSSSSSSSLIIIIIIILTTLPLFTTSSSPESFIYVGCSQLRYNPNTPYESNVNSMLSSFVNSASISNFNNFKISLPGSTQNDIVYGIFQCRGDLTNSDCRNCVANAVTRLGTICVGAAGGALQLEGCFIKYDNLSFLSKEDKSVISNKCGPPIGSNDLSNRRDALLDYLSGSGQYFRMGGSGRVQGMVQCVQDLSMGECQDCLTEAIQRLKTQCASSGWGDMFLGKCYARYSERGYTSSSRSDPGQKTVAIIVASIAIVAILVIFLSCWSRARDRDGK